ncbi:MAG: hypothetical protein IT561_20430 [Alphaproteobacteria bacterium]|nr:hypothetical protein [Alphaproteobacteria bacterium]
MRLRFLVAAAALALAGAPSAASAYQLCARSALLPQQLSEIAGSVQVGALTYNITFKTGNVETCVEASSFGQVQAKTLQQMGMTSCQNAVVADGNSGKVLIQVGISYVVENRQAPYYLNSCYRA